MELPEKVKIGVVRYKIIRLDGDIHWGTHTYGKAKICIDDELADEAIPCVLWHEVLHAMLHQGGYSKPTLTDEQYDFLEQIVTMLPFGIVQVLRDNPALRKL